ncbi:hypothetical protein B0J18DRAFT_438049 [Chaetomium sp. MPI-SDFR-AT-0129]|nr:hypothetical protein B0J18DRAFT_438049 [Chaetomium sp. MPI-SDFR-AT-0129]
MRWKQNARSTRPIGTRHTRTGLRGARIITTTSASTRPIYTRHTRTTQTGTINPTNTPSTPGTENQLPRVTPRPTSPTTVPKPSAVSGPSRTSPATTQPSPHSVSRRRPPPRACSACLPNQTSKPRSNTNSDDLHATATAHRTDSLSPIARARAN